MRIRTLLPFLFFTITGVQAQTCNCKLSYQWVKKTFEENDAGYAHILKIKGQEAYALHDKLTLKKMEKIKDLDSCIKELQNWVRFFRKDHFRFTKTKKAIGIQESITGVKPVSNSQFNSSKLKDDAEYYLIKTTRSPFGYKRDSNTVYIHINSFNYENKKAIDSLLHALHATIVSTPNLIIDLRDCQGGADASFQKIIPYLYTNPIRSVMAEFYSTPLNNKIWKDLSERAGSDAEEKETYGKIGALMNNKLGQFVNIFGKDVEVLNLDTIFEYPKNVGIIIHENNFSTTEEFILKAKQSKKVKFFGRKTGGALDVSNMIEANDPQGNFVFEYCISRSLRIPEFPVDDMGLHPDFYLDQSIPENEWVSYTSKILNYKK